MSIFFVKMFHSILLVDWQSITQIFTVVATQVVDNVDFPDRFVRASESNID